MTEQVTESVAAPALLPTDVSRFLVERQLGTIIVIDDMLDPPRWSTLPVDVREAFASELERDETLREWLKDRDLLPPATVLSDDVEEYPWRLQQMMAENNRLRDLWMQYLDSTPQGDRADVLKLVDNLKALGGPAVLIGSARHPPIASRETAVVFIDYTLEVRDEDASINILNDLYRDLGDDTPRPMIVLMSSGEIASKMERFRTRTGTMPGMFLGVKKENLQASDDLYMLLGAIAQIVGGARNLQKFTNAVAATMTTAISATVDLLRGFAVEDFAYIQLLSLNSDGHPLGDYVLWLLSAYFAKQLAMGQGVRELQPVVDALAFAAPPLISVGHPSDAFVRSYSAAVFAPSDDEVGAVRYPPLTEEALKESGSSEAHVAIHFGDLFLEASTNSVYMVATPECDLAFGGNRAFPRERSVVLVPGKLSPADRPLPQGSERQPRTELFHYNDKLWRIEWKIKQTIAVSLGSMAAWKANSGTPRMRVAQVRFPFATEIQQAYAADLTRVGVPVTPPLVQRLSATLYTTTSSQKAAVVCGPIASGAYVFSSSRYRKYILAENLLRAFRAKISDVYAVVKEEPPQEEILKRPEGQERESFVGKARERAKSNAAAITRIASDLSTFLALRGPFELNTLDKLTKVSEHLTVSERALRDSGKYEASTVLTVWFEPEEAAPKISSPAEIDSSVVAAASRETPSSCNIVDGPKEVEQ